MHDTAFSPSEGPYNAFSPTFLERFGQNDEPASAAEADLDGPWEVRRSFSPSRGERFAIWRTRDGADRGDAAAGEFREEATALLACALRPLVGQDPLYILSSRRERDGFPIFRSGEPCGSIQLFEESWIFSLNLVERFVRSPEALAMLLEAAGPLACERAGRILHDRVLTRESSEPLQ